MSTTIRSDLVKDPRQTHYPYNSLNDGKLMPKALNAIDFSLRVKEGRYILKKKFLSNFKELIQKLKENYNLEIIMRHDSANNLKLIK